MAERKIRGSRVSVLIMAGGTGGHVYPALAVARELQARGVAVFWIGTRLGLEARLVPQAGIELSYISISGLRGGSGWSLLLAPVRLLLALLQALVILARRHPGAVLGMGGFVSGPGGVAAWLLRRALLVHEQNAVPGLTNRLLARLAGTIMEAFPGSFPAGVGAVCTGNPVRPELTKVPHPETRLAGRTGALRLLVLGGSQGARALNQVVPRALARLQADTTVTVRHQAGPRNLEETRNWYREQNVAGDVGGYIEDMAEAYAWADLVLCRAGAMTVAELSAVGVGSVLVPFPHAVDDHQTRNARYLSDAGAGVLLPQTELNAPRLADLLLELGGSRDRLRFMAGAARELSRPDATRRVADLCEEMAIG